MLASVTLFWINRCRFATATGCFLALTLSIFPSSCPAKDAEGARELKNISFDINYREFWTSSAIQGVPDPPDKYSTARAFPMLSFVEPLSMCLVPGLNKFCVATRSGKIFTFDNREDVGSAQLLIDIEKTVYGVAFHPDFERNGYFFVTNFVNPSLTDPTGARLSRFQVEPGKELTARPSSEHVVLAWPSGGHNGGCIRFGPDGYLYISAGDGSGIADSLLTGQDISDLNGSILRINVDIAAKGKPYAIPADNPFVNNSAARGEIWSYGHRNVWKFNFDRQHRLWAGDVGQDLWEAIYLIERGGNYGWSVQEGSHPFRPDRPRGADAIVPPIVEHPHSHFRSVTGGVVSNTPRLKELDGAYIYGDYDTGAIWALKYESGEVTLHQELADTQLRIIDFASDREGEVYIVDFVGGGIHRIVEAPPVAVSVRSFPRKLSESGLFVSTEKHIVAPGLIPYSVNAPLWSDGAEKDRYLGLPHDSKIEMDAIFYPHQPDYSDLGWKFPDGTVLMKTFSIALDRNRPDVLHRLETRILHFRQMPGDDDEYGAQVWNGYTYVWNDEQTDAELLGEDGGDRELNIIDPAAPGGTLKQVWHFPSRTECALCHTMGSKYVLGVTTLQLNKNHDYGGGQIENQLTVLNRLGVFDKPLRSAPESLPALIDYQDHIQPLHLRARAYLHANCAHCHRKWGGGNSDFELQASLPLRDIGVVNTRPGQGSFDRPESRIMVPGQPDLSLLWKRMSLSGQGRMPHVGSNVTDVEGLTMVSDWIKDLKEKSQLNLSGALRPRLPRQPSFLARLSTLSNPTLIGMLVTACLFLRWWNSSDRKQG